MALCQGEVAQIDTAQLEQKLDSELVAPVSIILKGDKMREKELRRILVEGSPSQIPQGLSLFDNSYDGNVPWYTGYASLGDIARLCMEPSISHIYSAREAQHSVGH
ncbi:hypothetical protein J4204_04870 [Candidatus Woesearchaeota archaeon]|nr:hypothetical protein [Candidatus Woesearchaeota archaeon]